MEPIRIFIATSANFEDKKAEMVYEYSLKKNTKHPVEITWMRLTTDSSSPWGGWNTETWSTPFSAFRWAIPEVCEFKGRAIYTDVDMINLKDIAELYNMDMEGKAILARRGPRFGGHEFCVMLMDCKKLKEHLLPLARMKVLPGSHLRTYQMLSSNSDIVGDLDPRWNCLDGEGRPIEDIWQLHFTKMSSQPWHPTWFTGQATDHERSDLVKLWQDLKQEAYNNGSVPPENYPAYGKYNIIGK
jgi:hypothetical protein